MSDLRAKLEGLRIVYNKTIEKDRGNVDEFVKSDIVKKMRDEGTVLQEIEEFNLPEVTCLICNSNSALVGERKFKKYKLILPLYRGVHKKDILSCLELDLSTFKKFIIPYMDSFLNKEFLNFFKEISDLAVEKESIWNKNQKKIEEISLKIDKEEKNLQKEKNKLEKMQKKIHLEEITSASEEVMLDNKQKETTCEGVESDNDKQHVEEQVGNNVKSQKVKIAATQKNIGELSKRKNELEMEQKDLQIERDRICDEEKRLEAYVKEVEYVATHYNEIMRKNRAACYEYIKTGTYKIETELIDMFLQKKFVKDIIKKIEDKENVISNIFVILRGNMYKSKEMQILVSMLEAGAIKTDDIYLVEYMKENKNVLSDYLITNFKYDIEQIEKDYIYQFFFNIALEQDMNADEIFYAALWDEIESVEIWKYIGIYINDEVILAKFVSGLRGRALRSFIEYISESDINMPSFTQALARQNDVNTDLIFRIVQNYEQRLSKTNRDIRRANKRLEMQENANASKVFTALYEPMERLEMLAYDIKMYDGQIKKKTIANQLIECVKKFRKGLEELEVYPLEEFDNWKSQTDIEYNSDLHRYEDGNGVKAEKVNVKTLGYRYSMGFSGEFEANEVQLEYAKVVPVKE